jgi:hypothetical protein
MSETTQKIQKIESFLSDWDQEMVKEIETFLIENDYYYTMRDSCGNILLYIFSIDTIELSQLAKMEIEFGGKYTLLMKIVERMSNTHSTDYLLISNY